MKAVIDTSVVISGLRNRNGASAEVLRLVLRGELLAGASTALMLEYEATATRPEHLAAAGMTSDDMHAFIDSLAIRLSPVHIHWRIRPASPDPGDDMLIEAGLNFGADLIVTKNLRDVAKPAARFGIRTVAPSVLLSSRKQP